MPNTKQPEQNKVKLDKSKGSDYYVGWQLGYDSGYELAVEESKQKMANSNEWWNKKLNQQKIEVLERVNKEVIGELVNNLPKDTYDYYNGRNKLRLEQRQKLDEIKGEI